MSLSRAFCVKMRSRVLLGVFDLFEKQRLLTSCIYYAEKHAITLIYDAFLIKFANFIKLGTCSVEKATVEDFCADFDGRDRTSLFLRFLGLIKISITKTNYRHNF